MAPLHPRQQQRVVPAEAAAKLQLPATLHSRQLYGLQCMQWMKSAVNVCAALHAGVGCFCNLSVTSAATAAVSHN
jgi:hypothetical protein